MRILYVNGDRGIRYEGTKGASIHLRSVIDAWRSDGHEVVLASKNPPPFRSGLRHLPAVKDEIVEALDGPRAPDVVYERYSLACTVGRDVADALGIPFVLEVNAPLVDEATRHRPDTVSEEAVTIERELLRRADVTIAVSNPLARILRDAGARRVEVVHNGFDPSKFRHFIPHRERISRLAFLGHPKPWHGAARIVPILGHLVDSGLDARAIIIGGGRGAETVRELASRAGLADRLEITGAFDHAAAIRSLSMSTVAIAPYPPTEPFYFCPIKVIEGMAAGCGVVTTRLGDIEVITGDSAHVVEADDDAIFADAVGELLRDGKTCERLGMAARERVFANSTWGRAARQVLSAIEAIASRSER